jgi:hypothetical protein
MVTETAVAAREVAEMEAVARGLADMATVRGEGGRAAAAMAAAAMAEAAGAATAASAAMAASVEAECTAPSHRQSRGCGLWACCQCT